MVLCNAEREVAGLEGGVAEVFEGGRDGQDLVAGPFGVAGFLVFGVVFVGVAGGVGGLVGRGGVGVAGELTAVCRDISCEQMV